MPPAPLPPQLVRTVPWKRLRGEGTERFELFRQGDEWLLRGSLVVLNEDDPVYVDYEIVCDAAWNTRRADIALRSDDHDLSLALTVEDGRWYESGKERLEVRGCVDIDLGWSPSTNTLPIRRLGLAVGEKSGILTAAWVRFPELTLEPLPQEYQRLAERRYLYSSRGGAFTAELDVDDNGLVIDYEGIWEQVS